MGTLLLSILKPAAIALVGLIAGFISIRGTYKSVTEGVAQKLAKDQREREERRRRLTERHGIAELPNG
jgi:hypothetical protein